MMMCLSTRAESNARAFRYRTHLLSVEMHEDVEKIEEFAFDNCHSLTGIKLLDVTEVEQFAFFSCDRLSEMDFGANLEIIGRNAFSGCPIRSSIRSELLNMGRSIIVYN